jgi:hypothetical protein
MPSQGPFGPTSASSSPGLLAWSSPTSVEVQDDIGATVVTGGAASETLTCTGFGFTIPFDPTGIVVSVRRQIGDGVAVDVSLRLVKAGVPVGDDKADAVSLWPTTYGVASYGGASDLWGTTWTAAEVNAANFGVEFSANSGLSSSPADVDFISITVFYGALALDEEGVHWVTREVWFR